MGRLKTLGPRVQTLPSRIATTGAKSYSDPNRGSRHERGYGTAWDKLRLVILKRDCGLCQVCKASGRVTSANIVDHKVPKAQGGTDDDANLQAICKPCHDAKTIEERGGRPRGGADADGMPTDPAHPWNQPPGGAK